MAKKAVMYGGGNIGRGFIGMLFSQSGYEVTFVDVVKPVIEALNKDGKYPVRIVSTEGYEDIDVLNVSAVDGNDQAATAEKIAECDIMATAVGVNILKFIIGNLVAGIRLRKERDGGPLNIIICENLMDANKVVEGMLKAELNEDEIAWFDENVGLVEASIGRMVPVQTDEMKDGNPLRVCVESYGFLPVDKAAFKGGIPEVKNMIPFEPFDFYIRRKLSPADRMIGSSKLCLETGVFPAFISLGAAGAVYEYIKENEMEQTDENAAEVLSEISELADGDELKSAIISLYGGYRDGKSIRELRKAAEVLRASKLGPVV